MLKYNVLMIMKKLDSSVKHWNNTKGATRMTSSATYLDHKRRILKQQVLRKSYVKSSINENYTFFMHAMVFIINGECDMAVGLTFKDNTGANVQNDTIKSIVYEDDAQDKYTFGVDSTNNNIFNTFKYKPKGAAEIDYSATATNFMTGGAIAGLLGKLTTIETATNAANLGDKVTAINTAVSKPNLEDKLTAINTAVSKPNLEDKLKSIQDKTDKMPVDLNAELGKLTIVAEAIGKNGNVTEAAKLVLENSFKQAITDAGTNGSNWLKNEVKGIVSQPSFDIPAGDDAALNWTW